jgi:hypothetical protein
VFGVSTMLRFRHKSICVHLFVVMSCSCAICLLVSAVPVLEELYALVCFI